MIILGRSRDEANEYAKVYVEVVAKIGELLDPDVTQGERTDLDDTTVQCVGQFPKQTKSHYRKIARIEPDTRLRYYEGVEDIISLAGLLKFSHAHGPSQNTGFYDIRLIPNRGGF